jgi:hypothetical protein
MKWNFTFIKDLFTEEKGGKFSSKKFWGHVFCALVAVTYVMDGWHFYKINENLFNSLLIAGVTLLGLTLTKSWLKGGKSSTNNTPSDKS